MARGVYSTRSVRNRVRLNIEPLEDRTVPAVFVVNVTADTIDANPDPAADPRGSGEEKTYPLVWNFHFKPFSFGTPAAS